MTLIRVATLDDVPYLAANLRQADIDELTAVGGTDVTAALICSLEASTEKWCAVDPAGNTAALFGVAPSQYPGVGMPWMIATDYINSVPKETIRQTRRYVQRMHVHYPILTQMVDYRNVTSVCWMQWLGFKIHRVVVRHGVENRPFIHFIRRV